MCGLDDKTVREILLRDNQLTLDKAISIAKAAEVSKSHIKALEGKQVESAEVKKVEQHLGQSPSLRIRVRTRKIW